MYFSVSLGFVRRLWSWMTGYGENRKAAFLIPRHQSKRGHVLPPLRSSHPLATNSCLAPVEAEGRCRRCEGLQSEHEVSKSGVLSDAELTPLEDNWLYKS